MARSVGMSLPPTNRRRFDTSTASRRLPQRERPGREATECRLAGRTKRSSKAAPTFTAFQDDSWLVISVRLRDLPAAAIVSFAVPGNAATRSPRQRHREDEDIPWRAGTELAKGLDQRQSFLEWVGRFLLAPVLRFDAPFCKATRSHRPAKARDVCRGEAKQGSIGLAEHKAATTAPEPSGCLDGWIAPALKFDDGFVIASVLSQEPSCGEVVSSRKVIGQRFLQLFLRFSHISTQAPAV